MVLIANIIINVAFHLVAECSPFGPPFPITASWFSTRSSVAEWDRAFDEFSKFGGDSVLTKAPAIEVTSNDAFRRNMKWAGCVSSQNPRAPFSCYDEALHDLSNVGLDIYNVLLYENEEDYNENITRCPLDRKIVSSETYHRIILPGPNSGDPCETIPAGSKVVVLFTRYEGPDSNSFLLHSAAAHNISVYLGLPGFPRNGSEPIIPLLPAYKSWIARILNYYEHRYPHFSTRKHTTYGSHVHKVTKDVDLYETIKGYYVSDQCPLINVSHNYCLDVYKANRDLIHAKNKSLILSTSVDVRKIVGGTVEAHRNGFRLIVRDVSPDVIIIHEGRGHGRGCYYWPTQENSQIWGDDNELSRIIQRHDPYLNRSTTYHEYFTASNQEVYQALQDAKDNFTTSGQKFDFWLGIEAFEDVTDNPCTSNTPVFPSGVNRATFERVQRAIATGSAMVQKVAAVAWDPFFTCKPASYSKTLAAEINDNFQIPMIAKCFMHSAFNRSVVLVGYAMEGETQAFSVDWPQIDGKRHYSDQVYGYYFELDYGNQHHLVPSLEYTQLYDPYNVFNLAPKGYVRVSAGSQLCIYTYDFSD